MSSVVKVSKEKDICTVTINRPERRNALTPEGFRELAEAIGAAGADREVRAIVLRGASEQAFCVGLDLEGGTIHHVPRGIGEDANLAIESCPCPVIAMVYGYAIGGGLGLVINCDLSIAADNARCGLTMVKVGAVYYADGIDRLIRTVGLRVARRLLYTGRLFDAQESLRLGLVDEVVPVDQLEKATYDLAREIAEQAPLSVWATKASISKILNARPLSREVVKELYDLRLTIMDSEDTREGRRAFAEKRKPAFKGK